MPAPKRTPERQSRSGPNIPEDQRHTVRVRLRREDHERAERLARQWGCTVPEAVARALHEIRE